MQRVAHTIPHRGQEERQDRCQQQRQKQRLHVAPAILSPVIFPRSLKHTGGKTAGATT
jgi:hypothetical protein